MAVKKMGVLGAGTMGTGIAQVGAQAGLKVVLVDIVHEFVDRAIAAMKKNWQKAVSKGKLGEEDAAKYANNIQAGSSVNDFKS